MQERQVNGYTVMVKNVPLADRNADALARVFNYVQPNKVWCASLISTTVNTKVAFFFGTVIKWLKWWVMRCVRNWCPMSVLRSCCHVAIVRCGYNESINEYVR